jgi:hypothetical protein
MNERPPSAPWVPGVLVAIGRRPLRLDAGPDAGWTDHRDRMRSGCLSDGLSHTFADRRALEAVLAGPSSPGHGPLGATAVPWIDRSRFPHVATAAASATLAVLASASEARARGVPTFEWTGMFDHDAASGDPFGGYNAAFSVPEGRSWVELSALWRALLGQADEERRPLEDPVREFGAALVLDHLVEGASGGALTVEGMRLAETLASVGGSRVAHAPLPGWEGTRRWPAHEDGRFEVWNRWLAQLRRPNPWADEAAAALRAGELVPPPPGGRVIRVDMPGVPAEAWPGKPPFSLPPRTFHVIVDVDPAAPVAMSVVVRPEPERVPQVEVQDPPPRPGKGRLLAWILLVALVLVALYTMR